MVENRSPRNASFAFPGGHLRGDGNELRVAGRRLRLEPKQVDTLAYLLTRAGQVVSKEELLRCVWGGRHVTDDALTVVVYQLRRALGDRARSPRYIETIAKRGYRWIALPVRREVDALPSQGTRPMSAGAKAGAVTRWAARPAGGWRRWTLAGAILVGLAAGWIGLRDGRSAAVEDPQLRLAETRTLIAERTPDSLTRALEILDWKLAADPTDPLAWALKARALTFAAELDPAHRRHRIHDARQAADRALAGAPAASSALLSHGLLALLHEHDLPTATAALRRARRLAPEDPEVLQATSWWWSILGRHQPALDSARAAVALDPRLATRWSDLSFLARVAGDDEQALRAAEIALDMEPRSPLALLIRMWSKQALGRSREAVREYLSHLAQLGAPAGVLNGLREAFEEGGWPAFHRYYVRLLPPDTSPLNEAVAALYDDDPELALDHLEVAVRRGDSEMLWLHSLPELERLREHPRFAALAGRLGLRPKVQETAPDDLCLYGSTLDSGLCTPRRSFLWWGRLLI